MATICPVTNEKCPYNKKLINGVCEDQLNCPIVDNSFRDLPRKKRKIFSKKTMLISFYVCLLLILASFTYLYFYTDIIKNNHPQLETRVENIPPRVSLTPTNDYTVLINNNSQLTESNGNNEIPLSEITVISGSAIAPRRISIPSISLFAEIKNVTLNEYNLIEAYPSKDIVSWYENSAIPGEIGNAILMGNHYFQNLTAVFSKLSSLKNNDTIIITNDNGKQVTLTIYETFYIKGDILPKDILKLTSSFAKTTLISRAGQIDPETAEYDSFIIILAN